MDLKIGKTGMEEAQLEFSFSDSMASFPIHKAVAWDREKHLRNTQMYLVTNDQF